MKRGEILNALKLAVEGMAKESDLTGLPQGWVTRNQEEAMEASRYARDVRGIKDLLSRSLRLVLGESLPSDVEQATAFEWTHTRQRLHSIFGAPGDWGYETALGKALQALYGSH